MSDDRIADPEARIAALVKAGDDLADAFTYSQNVQGTLTADLFTVRQWREAKGQQGHVHDVWCSTSDGCVVEGEHDA